MKPRSIHPALLIVSLLFLFIILNINDIHAEWKPITSPTENNLNGIWGSSANNIFAVGGSGTILHYDGTEWTITPGITSSNLSEIWGSDPNNVFAVGDAGTILHYDGTLWTEMVSYSNAFLKGVGGTSENDVFAVGYADNFGVILHYDGNVWTTIDNGLPNYVWDIFGIAENNVYAVGYFFTAGTIYHHNGSSWSELAASVSPLYGIWGSAEDDVFAVGGGVSSSAIVHYNGSSWTPMLVSSDQQLQDVWGSASDNLYAVGKSGIILHYDGEIWTEAASGTTNQLQGIWGSSPDNIFAVGQGGTILHYTPAEEPVLSVTPGFQNVASSSGETSFQITNSGTGTMVWTASANADWLTITSADTGTNTGTLSVAYEANTDETQRTGSVIITASGAKNSPQTVEVKQAGLTLTPVLSVTPTYQNISENGGTTSFHVANSGTGTLTWTAKSNADWLTITSGGSGTDAGDISVSIDKNPAGTLRTGTITITAPNAEQSPLAVEVRQAAQKFTPFLSVNPTFLNLPPESGTTSFEVTNTGTGTMTWTITGDAAWYSVTPETGTDNGLVQVSDLNQHTVHYNANPGKSRTSTITITSPEAANSPQIIEIKQACGFELSVTSNLPEFSSNSGTAAFEIANTGTGEMEWSISQSGDWFSVVPNSGINHAVVQISYQKNATDKPRTGSITITADEAKNSPQIIKLKQERTDWMLLQVTDVNQVPISANLRGVWGSSENNVFAVGSKGTLLHYNGINWTKTESGTESYLRAIWGNSKENIFVVGYGGTILHYNGASWTLMESGVSENLMAIWGDSDGNLFVVGDNGTILRYSLVGSSLSLEPTNKWTKMQSPTFNPLYGIWGSSENDIFVVGGTWNSISVLHYDGNPNGKWTELPTSEVSNIPYGIWGNAENNILTVGNSGIILRYNGGSWNAMTSGTSDYLRGVWGSNANHIFAVGVSGTILQYNGDIWTKMTLPVFNDLYAIWGSSENDIFAVGNSGTILHFPYQAILLGDVDANHKVELNDAMLALKLLSGISADAVQIKADVNGDQKIGAEEAIYVLQKISGLK